MQQIATIGNLRTEFAKFKRDYEASQLADDTVARLDADIERLANKIAEMDDPLALTPGDVLRVTAEEKDTIHKRVDAIESRLDDLSSDYHNHKGSCLDFRQAAIDTFDAARDDFKELADRVGIKTNTDTEEPRNPIYATSPDDFNAKCFVGDRVFVHYVDGDTVGWYYTRTSSECHGKTGLVGVEDPPRGASSPASFHFECLSILEPRDSEGVPTQESKPIYATTAEEFNRLCHPGDSVRFYKVDGTPSCSVCSPAYIMDTRVDANDSESSKCRQGYVHHIVRVQITNGADFPVHVDDLEILHPRTQD